MKQYYLSVLLIFLSASLFAQDSHRQFHQKKAIEPCNLLVVYDFHYVKDTIHKKPLLDRQALEIGKTMSRYYSLYGEKIDSLFAYAKEDNINPNAWKQGIESELYEDFYMNYPQLGELLVSTGLAQREYQYTELIPRIVWTTSYATTTVILGYSCQQATTSFRGRKYDVWYTLEIPTTIGPWKLNGLPGLVLRAKTMDGLFAWEAVGIEQPKGRMITIYDKNNHGKIKYPMKFMDISRKQMRILQENRWKDPIGLLVSHGLESEIWLQDPKTKKITVFDKPGSYQKPYIPMLELE